jgi:hypothetical protein
MARGDVEEHELVSTLGVVVRTLLHQVARIAQRLGAPFTTRPFATSRRG